MEVQRHRPRCFQPCVQGHPERRDQPLAGAAVAMAAITVALAVTAVTALAPAADVVAIAACHFEKITP